jgi:small subunit ribosomal protein S21
MIKVKARSNESVEQMLRRFKKLCEKEGLTKEMKRTAYYEKPSERRRRRLRKAVKREQKNLQGFITGVTTTARPSR